MGLFVGMLLVRDGEGSQKARGRRPAWVMVFRFKE